RREVAAGAGGDPAAERAELERLREMPERETVRAEALLECRPEDARLDARGPRRAIDLEHAVEVLQIDRDRAAVRVVAGRLAAAAPAGRAAVRHGGDVLGRAPFEEREDLRLVTRERDDVGRIRVLAAKSAHHVTEGFAVGVRGTVECRGRAAGDEPRRR